MLSVLCVTILVINLDNTILNVALPTLVKALQAKSSELQLIVDSYAVVFAGLLSVLPASEPDAAAGVLPDEDASAGLLVEELSAGLAEPGAMSALAADL